MTFTSLSDDITEYCVRGGASVDAVFAGQVPSFINLTEQQIAHELKIQGLINVVTSSFTSVVGVYQKPNRWRETVSINIGTNVGTSTTYGTRQFLLPRSYEYCRTYWPTATETGTPKFYCDYNYENIMVVPTPAETNPFEMLYWQLPPPLDITLQTNFFTEYTPNALLDGALVRAFNFLKNAEQAAVWQAAFDRDMAALAGEDLQKILDRAQERRTS